MSDVVSAREAARLIGKNERTVRRWIEKGILQGAYRDETSGEFRVPMAALTSRLPVKLEQPDRPDGAATDVDMLPSTAADRAELAGLAVALDAPSWLARAIAAETRMETLRVLVDQVGRGDFDAGQLVQAARAILGPSR